jgi:hypothetical protein
MWFQPLLQAAAQQQAGGGAGNDVCTAAGFAVGSPVIGSPTLRQNHVITGSGFAVGSPAIGTAHRDVVVRLSETHPATFFRLVNEVEQLFVQGGELGKPRPSGQTDG